MLGSSNLDGAVSWLSEVKRYECGNENCGEACLRVLDEMLCARPTWLAKS
jgi:hypothetical protein